MKTENTINDEPIIAVEFGGIYDIDGPQAAENARLPLLSMFEFGEAPDQPKGFVNLLVVKGTEQIERMAVCKDFWEHLLSDCDWAEVKSDVANGVTLATSLEAQINLFEVNYKHDPCNAEWQSTWSCACDDACPDYGTTVNAVDYKELRVIEQADDGVWVLNEVSCDLMATQQNSPAARARP